jgi:predicted HNH restriction endonuclease
MAPGYNAAPMETATKPPLQATDRLRQTTAALARLLDQTMNDIKLLESEYHERIAEVTQQNDIRMTEELRTRFNEQISRAVDAVRSEMTAERAALTKELEQLKTERARLSADCQRLNESLQQSRNDLDRALAETDEAAAIALERQIATAVGRVRAELTSRWEAERAELLAERDRTAQALAKVETATAYDAEKKVAAAREQWENERAQLIAEHEHALTTAATAAASENQKSSVDIESLKVEHARVERVIQELSRTIENGETELSVVIRINAERAELESYLRGVRFALSGK